MARGRVGPGHEFDDFEDASSGDDDDDESASPSASESER
jgi:hypothetical protein